MNIINIRIKSQNDNANRTGPKKRKRAVMRKGWPRMMITVSTKSLLLGWMSISIWCDQNLLSCSSFLPWHQCAEKCHSIKRLRKELENKWFVGLLQVHPLWMVCPAHVIFMMTGKWDTSYHPMQSHSKRFWILNSGSFPLLTLLRALECVTLSRCFPAVSKSQNNTKVLQTRYTATLPSTPQTLLCI